MFDKAKSICESSQQVKKIINNYWKNISRLTLIHKDFKAYSGQQRKYFFQNALEIYTYSGAEWCPKNDVASVFP